MIVDWIPLTMEGSLEKDCGALGSLFVQIITEMKSSAPIWEDFIAKATKLHMTLRATLLATSAFLESFQKLADMATNTRGATRDIGSALTRLCMRHRSIENKLKNFTGSLQETLINPLQDKTEEWKKNLVQLDKDRSKDHKRAKQDIKKASSDTIRLQKKVKKGGKGGEAHQKLEHALQEVNDKFHILEETEKRCVRNAMIEERARFCFFITCLKPVVDHEVAMLSEATHLQEITQHLCLQVGDPSVLPPASEQVILDIKGADPSTWSFNQTPPSSPSSLGSRKSSMCSISSINSSSSGSTKSHSPSHHLRHRAPSQPPPNTARLSSISSQDSGFTSLDTLFHKPPSPSTLQARRKSSTQDVNSGCESDVATPSPSHLTANSTWSNWPDPPGLHGNKQSSSEAPSERPHTISSAYERSHSRTPLSSHTFEAPDQRSSSSSHYAVPCIVPPAITRVQQQSHYQTPGPPVKMADIKPPPPGPKPRSRPVAPPTVPEVSVQQAEDSAQKAHVYVNTNELAMAAVKEQDAKRDADGAADKDKIMRKQGEDGQLKRQQKRTVSLHGQFDQTPLRHVIDELHMGTTALRSSKLLQSERGEDPVKRESIKRDSVSGETVKAELKKQESMKKEPVTHEEVKQESEAEESATEAPNSLELAEAIKELEASTAALQMNYDNNPRNSLQCSSGYGTIASTPACSQQTISSADDVYEFNDAELVANELSDFLDANFCTLPRKRGAPYLASLLEENLPQAAPSVQPNSGNLTRRASMSGPKPPPPIRRTASISGPLHGVQLSDETMQNHEMERRHYPDNIHKPSDKLTDRYSGEDMALPPPPPELAHNGGNNVEDEEEEIDISRENGKRGSVVEAAAHRGSVVDSHAGVITSLNEKLTHTGSDLVRGRPPAGPAKRATVNDPTDVEEQSVLLMSQLKFGVTLRRSICNDRSAPRFT